tara:strand:- start:685 stop:945 length:261 start_codon:yes stop_codon:yes gene_type:complete
MTDKKKETPKKKTAPKKKAAPKKAAKPKVEEVDPLIRRYCDVPEGEPISESLLKQAHAALWTSNWRSKRDDETLAAIQKARGQRRP